MVKVSTDTAELLLKQKFSRMINNCQTDSEARILIEYFGVVNEITISELTAKSESAFIENGLPKSCIKKSFAILIEGLQNIYRHGLRTEEGASIGGFALIVYENWIQLNFVNLVNAESINTMNAFCQRLNSMSLEQVKVLYMETLSSADLTEKGGASLGCMLMKLKSDGNLLYSFESVEKDISCFNLAVKVMKQS